MAPPLMLDGNVDTRDETIAGLRMQVRQLDEALRLERIKTGQVESGVRELRHVLNPLYRALQKVFGEIEDMGIEGTPANLPVSFDNAVWGAWKSRLGNACSKIIDAFLARNNQSMNQTQIAMATGLSRSNMATYIHKLNKAGLINKNGNEYTLKSL